MFVLRAGRRGPDDRDQYLPSSAASASSFRLPGVVAYPRLLPYSVRLLPGTPAGNPRIMRKSPKITLRGFRPGARGAGMVLGELQTEVMEALWREPGLNVNEVEERLRRKREIAHTLVQQAYQLR